MRRPDLIKLLKDNCFNDGVNTYSITNTPERFSHVYNREVIIMFEVSKDFDWMRVMYKSGKTEYTTINFNYYHISNIDFDDEYVRIRSKSMNHYFYPTDKYGMVEYCKELV